MKTINRTAITIVPSQPYIDWADSFNNVKVYYKEAVTTILIPDSYDEFNYEKFIKKTYTLMTMKWGTAKICCIV